MNDLVALGNAMTRLTEFVAAAFGDESIPARPDDTVRELVADLIGEYRWTIANVMAGERVDRGPAPEVSGPLEDAFAATASALLAAFQAIDPNQPTPNFTRIDERAAFWLRRQTHRTIIAAVDAGQALGLPAEAVDVPTDVAEDGIAEIVQVLFPWMTGMGSRPDLRGAIRLVATDINRSWIVLGADDQYGTPVLRADTGTYEIAGELAAPASTLYLGLWQRIPAVRLRPSGVAAAALLTGPSVPAARF